MPDDGSCKPCSVHCTAQYKNSMEYLDEICSDHMELRPMFVCIIHIYENDYELVAYFYIFYYITL